MSGPLVPYVTAYDGEDVAYQLALAPHLEATNGVRLSYVDPVASDWRYGVLWHRHGLSRAGDPVFAQVNTARQRRCMVRNLCQVCGQTAVQAGTGLIWWVMADPPGRNAASEPFTHAPPTCRACIPVARRACPRLRRDSQVYTATHAEPFGVVADVFKQVGPRLITVDEAVELPLDAFRALEYALAKQLIVSVGGLHETQLDDHATIAA